MMHRLARLSFILFSIGSCFINAPMASAQLGASSEDPRQLAHDIYVGVNRASPPASIALKLAEVIRVYRFSCKRVTDYQVFIQRPNLIDIKAKCSGDPLYGVTVASNGYVAVYGGNGIVSALDRRDAIIYSFAADGGLEADSRLTADEAFDETVERLQMGGEYDMLYAIGTFGLLFVIVITMVAMWFRMWRKRSSSNRVHRKVKPMARFTVQAGSEVKNQLMKESTRVARNVFKHPSGVFIGRDKLGKRRFFKSLIWAVVFRTLGIRLFETSAPTPLVADYKKANQQQAVVGDNEPQNET